MQPATLCHNCRNLGWLIVRVDDPNFLDFYNYPEPGEFVTGCDECAVNDLEAIELAREAGFKVDNNGRILEKP